MLAHLKTTCTASQTANVSLSVLSETRGSRVKFRSWWLPRPSTSPACVSVGLLNFDMGCVMLHKSFVNFSPIKSSFWCILEDKVGTGINCRDSIPVTSILASSFGGGLPPSLLGKHVYLYILLSICIRIRIRIRISWPSCTCR